MATLQVRDIDGRLYESLRRKAARDHRSLSQEVVKMLEEGMQRTVSEHAGTTEAFLALSGSWKDRRTASAIAADLRKSRADSARFGVDRVVFD
jgi:plasmid stability protein